MFRPRTRRPGARRRLTAQDSDEAAGSVGMGPRAFGPSGFAQVYSTGRLYALATADTTVAVAGEDRTVVVYDVRKWSSILGTWSSCLKNDVTGALRRPPSCGAGTAAHDAPTHPCQRASLCASSREGPQASWLAFRDDDKRYCYVSGTVDSELACGSWDALLGRFGHLDNVSLRVDGRWIGTDKVRRVVDVGRGPWASAGGRRLNLGVRLPGGRGRQRCSPLAATLSLA